MQHRCDKHEHDLHIAEAVNAFRTECGDEDTWTPQEARWHDLLLKRIDREDGYADHCQQPVG